MMCHMVADDLDELHVMADAIGLKREWYQNGRWQHYDVSKTKRRLAIQHGAIAITDRDIVGRGLGKKESER